MANRRAMKLSIELLAMIEEFVQRLWQKERTESGRFVDTDVCNIKKKRKEYFVNIAFNYIVEKVYAIKLWNCCEAGIGRELFLLRKLQHFFAKINNSCRWWMEGGVDWIIGRFVGKVRDSNGSMVNLELTSVTVPCYNFTVTVEWNEVKK